MKKMLTVITLVAFLVLVMVGCVKKEEKSNTIPSETGAQAETIQPDETVEKEPAFQGGELMEGENDPSDGTEETLAPTEETQPKETTPSSGIPPYSGGGNELEPPANSSAGEL